jgi:hypothetical protein
MLMSTHHKSGYAESSIGHTSAMNLLPVMVPIRGEYADYGDFRIDQEVDYGLMTSTEFMKLVASRIVHRGERGEVVRSFDLQEFDPDQFISSISTDENDYHMEAHKLYWYMSRFKEGSQTEMESIDAKLYRFPIRLVAVLKSVWDMMLAQNCHFWKGSFQHRFVEETIREFMSSARSPTHRTRAMTGPGLSYNSMWDDFSGKPSLKNTILETHLMNRYGEGDRACRLYTEQSETDTHEFPDLNRNHDFVRELLKKRKFSEGGWFEPTDNDALTRYFLAWSEYVHVSFLMSQLRKVWTTVCGAGSQHDNCIVVANFNNGLAKIASTRAISRTIEWIDYGDGDYQEDELNDAADAIIKSIEEDGPDPAPAGDDLADKTVIYEVVQRIELKAENIYKYSNGTRETLLELRKKGVDLTMVRNIICEKD